MEKHLVIGPPIRDGVNFGTVYSKDGGRQDVAVGTKESLGVEHGHESHLEPCDESGRGDVFHVFDANETGHRGPPRANSTAYRCGWEEIFSKDRPVA